MKAIAINEENHGLVGIAKDYSSAIDFLIADEWLDGYFRVYPLGEDNPLYERIEDAYGENWAEKIKSFSEEEIDELFDGSFYFKQFEVFGA